ncbi:Hypothetical predicted protein, partial [Podarcis lilfordi]
AKQLPRAKENQVGNCSNRKRESFSVMPRAAGILLKAGEMLRSIASLHIRET